MGRTVVVHTREAEGDTRSLVTTAGRAGVELGLRRGGRVEVTTGLQAGDRIVSAGTHKVAPGTPLEIVEPRTSEAARP